MIPYRWPCENNTHNTPLYVPSKRAFVVKERRKGEYTNKQKSQGNMSMPTEMSAAAAAVAESKLHPGDEYEEIREQVRNTISM